MRLSVNPPAQPSLPLRNSFLGMQLASLRNAVAGMVMGVGVLVTSTGCDASDATPAAPYPEYMDEKSKEVRSGIDNTAIEDLLTRAEQEFIQTVMTNPACGKDNKKLIPCFTSQGDATSYGEAVHIKISFTYSCHNGRPKPSIIYRALPPSSYYPH